MANPSKEKGTKAETKVARYLQAQGFDARRQPLSGNKDKGDVVVESKLLDKPMILEVKAGAMTANPNRSQIAEWLRQSEVEAENAGGSPMLVVVRYRRSIDDADCWYRNECGQLVHLYLDELAEYLTAAFSVLGQVRK